MSVLKIKDANGDWQDIPAIKGADGAIQYTAGTNIQIADDTISTTALNQTQVQNLIDTSIQALGDLGFTPTVVQELPVSHIDTHTIYLVPKNGSTGDVYDEYLYINNNWEHIGSTEVDLSNYYTKTEVDTKTSIPTITILPAQMTSLTTCQFTAEQRALLDDNKYGIYYMVGHNIGLADGVIYKSRAYTENNVDYIDFASVYEASSIVKSLRGMYNKSTGEGTFSIHEILTTSNTTSYTPSSDYNPATKKYVDDAVAAVGGSIPILDLYTGASNNSIGFLYQTTGSIVDAVNNFLKEGHNYFYINLVYNGNSTYGASNFILKPYWKPTDDIQSQNWTLRLYSDVQMFPNITKRPFIILIDMQTAHNNDNELYITYFRINTTFMDNYLAKDNTTSYTPTGDYNPTTKKYVDDAIAGVGGNNVPAVVEEGDYVSTISNESGQISLTMNYDNDSRINLMDIMDGTIHIASDASMNGETKTADVWADASSAYASMNAYSTDTHTSASVGMDADDTNGYAQIQASSGVIEMSTNTYDGNGDPENDTGLYVDATTQTIHYVAPNGFKGQTPVASDDIATKGYVDNQIGNINTVLATLTTPSNGGN